MTWRVGHKVPRNLYLNDEPIALLATPKLAAGIADSLNESAKLRAEVVRLRDYLRGIEWNGATSIDYECEYPACPECGGLREDTEHNAWKKPVGHQAGCRMPGMITTSDQPKEAK